MSAPDRPDPYLWMKPALWIGRVRPGLAAATAVDRARLAELPPLVGAVLLPLLAIGVPVMLSVLHLSMGTGSSSSLSPFEIFISDVFSESLPFMVIALMIGLASPAAGVLVALVYAVGNLTVTVLTDEMAPIHLVLLGRLVSYWLLWLLVVEVPLLARSVTEWRIGDEPGSRERRWGGVALGAAVAGVLTFIWAQAVPLLITIVFWWTTRWANPTIPPIWVLQAHGLLLSLIAAAAALAFLALRYLGPAPLLAVRGAESGWSMPGGPVAHLVWVVILLLLLGGVARTPIDAVILGVALLVGRPLTRIVLRATRLGEPLARIPWAIRLIVGFGAAFAVAWVFLGVTDYSTISPYFNMVVSIAVGYLIIDVLVSAEQVATSREESTTPAMPV